MSEKARKLANRTGDLEYRRREGGGGGGEEGGAALFVSMLSHQRESLEAHRMLHSSLRRTSGVANEGVLLLQQSAQAREEAGRLLPGSPGEACTLATVQKHSESALLSQLSFSRDLRVMAEQTLSFNEHEEASEGETVEDPATTQEFSPTHDRRGSMQLSIAQQLQDQLAATRSSLADASLLLESHSC